MVIFGVACSYKIQARALSVLSSKEQKNARIAYPRNNGQVAKNEFKRVNRIVMKQLALALLHFIISLFFRYRIVLKIVSGEISR